MIKKILKILCCILLLLVVAYIFLIIFTKPRNDRQWTLDQKISPEIQIDGDKVSVKNIRNFSYKTTKDYTPGYYDSEFDLSKIVKAYYFVEPFAGEAEGAAHTFLSFEFEDDKFVSISVEIRKEMGESFSALKGLLRQYELVYVIADERDVVKLRTNYRKDDVYMYPLAISEEKTQALFLSMINRAKDLQINPEFYNTLTSTCTSNIIDHARKISDKPIPRWHRAVLLPNYSDQLAQELGLLEETEPVWDVREKYKINALAEKYADDPEFSKRIRGR